MLKLQIKNFWFMLKFQLFFGLFLVIAFTISYLTKEYRMDVKNNKFSKLELSGYVEKGYFDSANHLNQTVIFNKFSEELIMDRDASRMFYYVKNGDSIFKKKNSLKIEVYNVENQIKVFNINFK
jgi:hypothetical protein